jgi:hypothetical protein
VPEDRFDAIQGLTPQPSSTEDCELPLAKIYENCSLDHFFFCTFNPRSNAGLLRECTRDDHDHNTSDYCNAAASSTKRQSTGLLLRGYALIAAATLYHVAAFVSLTIL